MKSVRQHNPRTHRTFVMVLFCGGLSSAAIAATTVPSAPSSNGDWFDAKVKALDSSRLSDRVKAHEELSESELKTLDRIGEALRSRDLSVEQRQRLSNLGRQIFDSMPRAALGIQWGQMSLSDGSVIVGGTVGGFDASRVLQAGDRLLKISGTEISGRDVARAAIMSHDPGDIAVIQILRKGETETVEVRMGSFADLDNRRESPEQEIIRRAWAIRLARLSGGDPVASIATGLNEEAWIAIELDQQRITQEAAARVARSNVDGPSARVRNGEGSPLLHTSRAEVGSLATDKFEALEIDATMAAQAAGIQRQLDGLNRSLVQLRELSKRPDLDDRMRKEVELKIAATEQHIIKLKTSLPYSP